MTDSDLNFSFYRGPVVQSVSDKCADFIADGLVLVGKRGQERGRIVAIGAAEAVATEHHLDLERGAFRSEPDHSGGLWLPAFFDTHFHWVQDAVREMPKYSLIEWLKWVTFPEEARFANVAYAEEKASSFWRDILSLGTVGGLCYSSIHEVALEAAFRHAPEDFYIGNVLMTMECPDYLRQGEAEAVRSVQRCAEQFGARYVASPRFAPTTAPSAMRAAAEAARRINGFQQTHLGETLAEIDWVLSIYQKLPGFEDVRNYTEIYDRVGMLGEQTVFGHCLHLAPEEWKLLADSGSRIASCPTSNAPVEKMGLGSGLFDYPTAEAHGIPWSLASDIGGGPYLSMFDVMHSFVEQNRELGRDDATYTKALHRATAKGAALMNLPNRGVLREGACFDAIRVTMPKGAFQSGPAEPVLKALHEQIPDRRASEKIVLETFIKGASRFRREGKLCA